MSNLHRWSLRWIQISSLVGLLAVIATSANAQFQSSDKEVYALCAAANALLAATAEPGMYRDLFSREAQRHAEAARARGATTSDLEQTLRGLRAAYEGGNTSWAQIADTGKECTKL